VSKVYGFCAVISRYRLYQFIALYRSLESNMKNFIMFIHCTDEITYEILKALKLKNAIFILQEHIEDENILSKRLERQLNEYCWTLKPILLQYILINYPNIVRLTYIDSDLYFYYSPEIILNQKPESSILLSQHDFPSQYKFVANQSGRFNSGFISFKKDKTSTECLEWWIGKCMDWCYDRPEKGRYGDQKYLEMIPILYRGVWIIKTKGSNVAPWNDIKYKFSTKNGKVYVDGSPLVFYHFSGFRILSEIEFALTIGFEKKIINNVHMPYFKALQEVIKEVKKVAPEFNGCFIEEGRKPIAEYFKLENETIVKSVDLNDTK